MEKQTKKEKELITIAVELKTWRRLVKLKIDKRFKTYNDALNFLLKETKDIKEQTK